MRFDEFYQPEVGDFLNIEMGDALVETIIVDITEEGYVCETSNDTAISLLKEASAQEFETTEEFTAMELAVMEGGNSLEDIAEAEYAGRKVKLNKPTRGDVKKFKVYVRNPKTGRVVKVNFGDPNMRIKKFIPARRKSFRARHNCDNPGPKTKARYWSCRKW